MIQIRNIVRKQRKVTDYFIPNKYLYSISLNVSSGPVDKSCGEIIWYFVPVCERELSFLKFYFANFDISSVLSNGVVVI